MSKTLYKYIKILITYIAGSKNRATQTYPTATLLPSPTTPLVSTQHKVTIPTTTTTTKTYITTTSHTKNIYHPIITTRIYRLHKKKLV